MSGNEDQSMDGNMLSGKGKVKETCLEILRNFPDETLERQLADEELSRFLVTSDFTECDGAGPEAMWLLDAPGGVLSDAT